MKTIVSTVTRKGQVTIPREVRERLGLGTPDSVTFVFDEDGVRLRIQLHARRQGRQDALDQLQHALIVLLVVDADCLELVGEQVAQQLQHEALFTIHDGGGPGGLALLADAGPDLVKRLEVADDVLFRASGGGSL